MAWSQQGGWEKQLSAYTDTALQNNYLLKASQSRIAINEADVEYFQKNFLPEAGLFGSASYWYWLAPNKQKVLGNSLTDVYTEFSIKQTLYDGGKNKTQKEIASNSVLINKEAERSIRQAVIYNVAYTWLELHKAKKIITINENALEILNSHLQNAQALYNVGKASNVDILKIKVQIAAAKKEIDAAKSNLEQKQIQFNKLLGTNSFLYQPVSDDSLLLWANWENLEFSKGTLLSETLQNHPDLMQFDLKMEAKHKEEMLYKTENKPNIYTYGLLNWEDDYIPFSNNFNYNLGIGISYKIPYFKGSAYKIKMLESRLGAEELKNSKSQLLVDLSAGINDALSQLANKKSEVASNSEIIDLSLETLDNALLKYNAGQGNIIDVLDASSILTTAEINRYKSIIEYLQLIARINYYTGSDNKPF
jgi:outer membrane protein TolC